MTIKFTKNKRGSTVAHCLDFDLVCVGSDKERTSRKLRLLIKAHVEFGRKLNTNIYFPAPESFWVEPTEKWYVL